MTKSLCLILTCLLCQACGPPPPGPETKATLAVISALRQDQMTQLMDMVTPETREAFAQQLALDESVPSTDLAARLVTDFGWQYQIPRRPWPKVVEGKEDPTHRTVQVYLGRELVRFPVRKIGDQWKVDLLNARRVPEGNASD